VVNSLADRKLQLAFGYVSAFLTFMLEDTTAVASLLHYEHEAFEQWPLCVRRDLSFDAVPFDHVLHFACHGPFGRMVH
jgi:hypothetical protein